MQLSRNLPDRHAASKQYEAAQALGFLGIADSGADTRYHLLHSTFLFVALAPLIREVVGLGGSVIESGIRIVSSDLQWANAFS